MDTREFIDLVSAEGARQYRSMPWRDCWLTADTLDPYKILLSECMLQQTQVNRVVPKFDLFLEAFPTIDALASAQTASVLALWNGLGYNRRALYLHQAAMQLAGSANWTYEQLVACKGIGPNTAKAVLVYAYNQPHVYVETNVRTVCIEYLFGAQENIHDNQIIAKLEECLPLVDPRSWYWALMDVGAHIKRTKGNVARLSSGYKKQSTFAGSRRELRGAVLRNLMDAPASMAALQSLLSDDRLGDVLTSLEAESLIHETQGLYYLGSKP